MKGKQAEICHSWLYSSGKNFLQLASCIHHSCKIHQEIERKITVEERCLREIFEKRALIAEAVYGKQSFGHLHTVKALLSPLGAYLILDLPKGGFIERGLIREGAYSQN